MGEDKWHVSVIPCEGVTDYVETKWDIKPVYCAIENVTASINFQEYWLKPNDKRVEFNKFKYNTDVCQ